MANSAISIYKTIITPEKNMLIEDIRNFLRESFQYPNYVEMTYSNNNFQYIQLEADITIKINVNQDKISGQAIGNYVWIRQDSHDWFYFVVGSEWKSKKCIQLYLSLDSINTFSSIVLGDKSTIYREHRSRKQIDNIPEGIQPVFYKDPQEDNLILEDGTHKDWFLIYKNHTENTDAALDCFICTSDNIHVIADASKSYINISKLKIGYTYIVDGSIKVGTTEYKADYDKYNFPYIYKTADKVEMNMITGVNEVATKVDVTDNIEITSNAIKARFSETFTTYRLEIYNFPLELLITVPESSFIKSIDEIDRTDAKLNKIMRLPYCPVDYTYNNGIYSFDTETIKYNNTENLLQIKDLNMKFSHKVIPNPVVNPFPTLESTINPFDVRNDKYENKLYSSEFYQPRFVYDSFVYTFALEDLSQIIKYDNLVFNYVHTSTINNKSLIDFYNFRYKRAVVDYPGYLLINRNDDEVIYNSPYINYIKNGINYDKRNANFNLWSGLLSSAFGIGGGVLNQLGSRISKKKYSDAYETMRYFQDEIIPSTEHLLSYNKAHNTTDNTDAIYRMALNQAGRNYAEYTNASGILNAYNAQSNRYGKAIGISSIASAIGGVASTFISYAMSQRQIEQATEQAKNQAVSVYGADDIDLLKVYSKNKAKLSIYKTSDTMQKILGDLFYYTGYNAEARQYKPNTNSRYWFNFIQCDPDFNQYYANKEDEKLYLVNKYLDDLRIRYNKGVTIYHKRKNSNGSDVYDLSQDLENCELTVLNMPIVGTFRLSTDVVGRIQITFQVNKQHNHTFELNADNKIMLYYNDTSATIPYSSLQKEGNSDYCRYTFTYDTGLTSEPTNLKLSVVDSNVTGLKWPITKY